MDDLVKRLREPRDLFAQPTITRWWKERLEAADRIEALERQVKAADALAEAHLAIVETTEGLPGTTIQECRQISRKALAAYRSATESSEK